MTPGESPFQNYSHTFKSVLAPLEFYVRGGDDRHGPFHLDVVDSPTISRMTLHCEYPPYMHRDAARHSGGRPDAVAARHADHDRWPKPTSRWSSVQIDDVADENTPVDASPGDRRRERPAARTSFQFALPPLDADKTLLFTLRDADGIRSRDAVRLALAAIADEPPQVNVQLKGIGTAITPRRAVARRRRGDRRLRRGQDLVRVPRRRRARPGSSRLPRRSTDRKNWPSPTRWRCATCNLQPKQKLHWPCRPPIRSALEGGPNVGISQRYVLDVVTPEQLRSMLEARELMLRRRFETIVDELTDTRNLLATRQSRSAGRAGRRREERGSAEPGDTDGGRERQDAALAQSCRSSACCKTASAARHETLQVALAFDELREEMINNRVDTEELKTRLKDGVADPLKRIVETMFPRVRRPAEAAGRPTGRSATWPARRRRPPWPRLDAILVEMQQVLDKMLELETFNEVLDTLRQIIDAARKGQRRNERQTEAETARFDGVGFARADGLVAVFEAGVVRCEEPGTGAIVVLGLPGRYGRRLAGGWRRRRCRIGPGGEAGRVGDPTQAAGGPTSGKSPIDFRELEKLLLRMAELTAPTDPHRAALLRQAVAQSKERDIDHQFEELVALLRNKSGCRWW